MTGKPYRFRPARKLMRHTEALSFKTKLNRPAKQGVFSMDKADKPEISLHRTGFYIIFVLLFLISSGQLTDTFVNHDDWDWLIRPGDVAGYGTPWQKTLWEGRWVNYYWSIISQNLTANWTYLLFISLYTTGIWFVSYILSNNSFSAIVAIGLFFSPNRIRLIALAYHLDPGSCHLCICFSNIRT